MENPNEFFTLQSMATFAGATGATMVITNGMYRGFGFNPRWLGLLVAQALCLGIVANNHFNLQPGSSALVSDYFVAIVNGFLVYCSAAGVTGAAGTIATGGHAQMRARERGKAEPGSAQERRFLQPWF